MNTITTRSGKQLVDSPLVEVSSERLVPNDAITNNVIVDELVVNDNVIVNEPVVNDNVDVDETVLNDNDATDTVTNAKHDKSKSKVTDILIKHVLFPQKLVQAKLEKKYGKFLNLLKNVSIELPFLDAMSEIPAFPKFLKTLCFNGRKLDEMV